MANLNSTDRKKQLLKAAVAVACTRGYQNVRLDDVASAAQCTRGLVLHHFATIAQLKRAIMRAAVNEKVLAIIAQGIVANDEQALKASPELRGAALDSVR
jgi:AcrR family transcriptional regulator